MKQVKAVIAKDGAVKYESSGFVGGECKEVQKVFLGLGPVSDVQTTGEGHMSNDMPAYNELGYGGGGLPGQ